MDKKQANVLIIIYRMIQCQWRLNSTSPKIRQLVDNHFDSSISNTNGSAGIIHAIDQKSAAGIVGQGG